jgi:hypothetical protein
MRKAALSIELLDNALNIRREPGDLCEHRTYLPKGVTYPQTCFIQ